MDDNKIKAHLSNLRVNVGRGNKSKDSDTTLN